MLRLISLNVLLTGIFLSSVAIADLSLNRLSKEIAEVEVKVGAKIGVALVNTQNNLNWSYRGDERFPLTSVFKTILCGQLLYESQNSTLDQHDAVPVSEQDIVTYSPLTQNLIGQSMTLAEACEATMHTSDNTAANLVLDALGGPSSVTQFLRNIGDPVSRLDRRETALNEGKPGDKRDTTTPEAIVNTFETLLFKDVLSSANRQQLKQWMQDNQVTGTLLRSVLPAQWQIADRSGAGGFGSRSIVALVWREDIGPYIIAIFITETQASWDVRNQTIADLGETIFSLLEVLPAQSE